MITIQEYIQNKKTIQNDIIQFIEQEDNIEETFSNLTKDFNDQIKGNQNELKLLLHMIVNISNNHNRDIYFFSKIERIVLYFKDDIIHKFTNMEIFSIFKSNKRLLLFLIKEEIIVINESIVSIFSSDKYKKRKYEDYFKPEINQFKKQKTKKGDSIEQQQDDFEEKRKNGENDEYVCKLIRRDSIDEFITYFNKEDLSASEIIDSSIFETNHLLLENENINLIKYATFFGSVQIFKFLLDKKARLTSSLWIYAVHSRNPEIIHILENKKIQPKDETYNEIYKESIKCHHNNIANYIKENLLKQNEVENKEEEEVEEEDTNDDDKNSFFFALKYFNFAFIQADMINDSALVDLCKYDYYFFVDSILKSTNADVNKVVSNKKNITKAFTVNKKFESFDVDVDTKISTKKTALNISIEKGNSGIIELLLSDAKIDAKIPSIIKTEEMPPNESFDPNEYTDTLTALEIAIRRNDINMTKLLLSSGKVDINSVIKKSVDHGWGPGKKPEYVENIEETSLFTSIEKGNDEIIQLLLSDEKLDINALRKSSLLTYDWVPRKMGDMIAFGSVMNGYIKAHKKLIKKEMTALHYAVENEKEKMVKLLLLNNNIDVNMISRKTTDIEWSPNAPTKYETELNKTALYMAVENENEEIVKMLLERKDIDVNIPCKSTIVNFNWIVNEDAGDVFSANWEVEGHMKSDEKYSYKVKTALHLAVENENIGIINLLMNNKNIDVNAKDDKDRKPIDLTDNEEIMKLLSK